MNFNSIKVRLEHAYAPQMRCQFVFQFHKGAIRTFTNSSRVKSVLSYFNSIKVRLEHLRLLTKRRLTKFQFHKGAIRTFIASFLSFSWMAISIP